MSDEDSALDAMKSATQSGTDVRRQLADATVLALTILAHPDPSRVGERALLLPGRAAALSRAAPDFAPMRHGAPRPLAERRLSRTPCELSSSPDGSVVLDAGKTRTTIEVDGRTVESRRTVSSAELERGVVLLLAARVALVLHRLEPTAPDSLDCGLLGESAAMVRVRREIRRVADLPYAILLGGESGTGKELAARAIHEAGPRREGPFVAVNMGAIPRELAAVELFGSTKGAYTGADRRRRGYFERAEGGTLFLDEIAETPPEIQVHLLRALETSEIQPVGEERTRKVDVRVISATDADLDAAVRAGELRSPLLHRLGYEIILPALRERREDLGRLFYHFLAEELATVGQARRLEAPGPRSRPWVPADLVARLAAYDWPGNVRQLRNVVRQLVVGNREEEEMRMVPRLERWLRSGGSESDASAVQPERRSRAYRDPDTVGAVELGAALRAAAWEVKPAAEELGVSRPMLYELMKRFGIRRAEDLSREEILEHLGRQKSDLDAAAAALEVSKRGLKIRMKKLGLR